MLLLLEKVSCLVIVHSSIFIDILSYYCLVLAIGCALCVKMPVVKKTSLHIQCMIQ